jgi:hypothetical protein
MAKDGRELGASTSPISMKASPCNVEASVFVGDTGVRGIFSSVHVAPVMVRDGAIIAG